MLLYASLSTITVFVCKIQYLEMVNITDFEKESPFIFKLLHAYELKSRWIKELNSLLFFEIFVYAHLYS